MKVSLAQLEARLQTLIEGSAARFFPFSSDRPNQANSDSFGKDLASRLVSAMRANLRLRSDGFYLAPNIFSLGVHPSQARGLDASPDLIDSLAREIQAAGTGGEIRFPSPPVVNIVPDDEVSPGDIRIQVSFNLEEVIQTSSLEGSPAQRTTSSAPGGFIIVDGAQIFSIAGPVVNIGRSSRNDLVIEDLRVSREHAQLRAIHGRYVIFDLDSTGGTFINGQRVVQGILSSGDVISLAGVTLIFSQDAPFPTGETQPYLPNEE